MKATELERMDRNYANAMDQVVDLEKQSLRLNDQLDGYIDEMNEAKKKVQELEAIGKLKRKLSQYQEMFAWSLYKEGDQTLAVKKDVSIFQFALIDTYQLSKNPHTSIFV
jgi:predicted nuclease with TOPRIM domain